MKHLVTIGLLFFLSASPLLGCSGQQLDGGSNASSSSGQGAVTPDGSATDPGSSGGASIATKPLEGQVVGKPFRVASADLQFDKTNEQWFLHLRSYAVNCGVIEDREAATGPDASLVTIALPEPAAGTFVITYGDSHAATFQSGVYEAGGPEPSTESGKDGTLVFDTWSDVAGTSITGALQLTGNTSNVEGTFTAKICAAR